MLARSPITRADAVRVPLTIVQGAADTRVVRAESDSMVDAVRAAGADVDYLVFDDEGHLLTNPENILATYRALDRFLATHLGGRHEHDRP